MWWHIPALRRLRLNYELQTEQDLVSKKKKKRELDDI
jgi:hypothetical protein